MANFNTRDNVKSNFVRRPHSIKVPTQYKATAKILKLAIEKQKSLKSLIFEEKHARVRSLYSVLKQYSDNRGAIDQALAETGLLKDNPYLDTALAKVLVTELIFGRGQLSGESKPVQTVLNYKEKLKQAIEGSDIQKKGRCTVKAG